MIKSGDFVEINYVGKIKDTGEIFDLTDEALAKEKNLFSEDVAYGPIPIIVGAGHMLPGLDKAIEGMKEGESKTVSMEQPFGPRKEENVKSLPEGIFKKSNIEAKPGSVINIQDIYGKIQTVSAGRVVVDFNHPLAGKDLEYDIKVERILKSTQDKVNGLLRLHLRKDVKYELKTTDKEATVVFAGAEEEVPPKVMSEIAEEAKSHCGIGSTKFIYKFGE